MSFDKDEWEEEEEDTHRADKEREARIKLIAKVSLEHGITYLVYRSLYYFFFLWSKAFSFLLYRISIGVLYPVVLRIRIRMDPDLLSGFGSGSSKM